MSNPYFNTTGSVMRLQYALTGLYVRPKMCTALIILLTTQPSPLHTKRDATFILQNYSLNESI